ncbi:hypothetical protein BKA93DRAFT_753706 [Sparassis latifolia]
MRSAFAAALLSLPLAALAGAHDAVSFRRHSGAIRSSRRSSTNYTLVDKYVGEDFLNEWQFYDQADPTGGNVNYVSQSAAESAGPPDAPARSNSHISLSSEILFSKATLHQESGFSPWALSPSGTIWHDKEHPVSIWHVMAATETSQLQVPDVAGKDEHALTIRIAME